MDIEGEAFVDRHGHHIYIKLAPLVRMSAALNCVVVCSFILLLLSPMTHINLVLMLASGSGVCQV